MKLFRYIVTTSVLCSYIYTYLSYIMDKIFNIERQRISFLNEGFYIGFFIGLIRYIKND